ncbi:MAG: hypothetical protein D4R67_10580 [Bacteroidetes bacterium]|nr:MAG: hypothetical protein D4R67_10580 [Bacteroidota bacterium]
MDLSKILSISGRPGLYRVVSQAKNAVIVESLIDQKRFPAFGNEKMSSLEEISIFTTGEDLPLKDVLRILYEKLEGKESVDPKSAPEVLQEFFLGIVPEYDRERVYASDVKKVLMWYNLLLTNQFLDFSEEAEKKEEKEEKPVKKTSPRKVAKKS